MSRKKIGISSPSVQEQLELFVYRVDELRNTRLLKNGFNPSFSMNWHHLNGMRFQTRVPDDEDLRSYLLTFRQFISNDEPVYLFKIYNLCHQHITSDRLKTDLIESRKSWVKELQQGGIHLNYNGRQFTPEELTRLWINGFYFHSDYEMLRLLKGLLPHEHMLVKHIFLNHLIEATKRVLFVGNLIRFALKEGFVN